MTINKIQCVISCAQATFTSVCSHRVTYIYRLWDNGSKVCATPEMVDNGLEKDFHVDTKSPRIEIHTS